MKKPRPIRAAGWISIPVSGRATAGDQPRQQRHAGLVQRVRDAVGEQRVDARPGGEDLERSRRRARPGSRLLRGARRRGGPRRAMRAISCRSRACAQSVAVARGSLRAGARRALRREERRRDVALARVGQDRRRSARRATRAARATSIAAHTAAPPEMPASTPSRRASARAVSIASSSSTAITSSSTSRLSTCGHEPGADALDLVRARAAARQHRRGARLDRDRRGSAGCAP